MKKIALAVTLLLSYIVTGSEEILYWMIEDTAKVYYADGSYQMLPMLVPADVDSSLAARVRVTGGNLTEDTFLDLYFSDGSGESYSWPGEMGTDFGDSGSGYWGCGVPVGNQSPITDFASPEFSFMIELGNYSYDATSDTESWTTIASSASASYTSLQNYTYSTFDLNPPTAGIWHPYDFYAVPEPKSWLLMLVGAGCLLLRRKRVK